MSIQVWIVFGVGVAVGLVISYLLLVLALWYGERANKKG